MIHARKLNRFGKLLFTTVVAAVFPVLPVTAQEADAMVFCEYQPSLEDLVGEYSVTSGPSVLTADNRSVSLPQVETHQSTLAMIDGDLVLYADDTQPITLEPVSDDEPNWNGSDNIGGVPVLSTDDIGLTLGCDINTLVRLIGTGTATSQDGQQFEFTIRLFATLAGELVGGQSSWSVDGMTMKQRLLLEETRN